MKTRKSKRCAGRVATIKARIRPDIKERLEGYAARAGMTLSRWLIMVGEAQGIREDKYPFFRPPPQFDPKDLAQAPVINTAEEDAE